MEPEVQRPKLIYTQNKSSDCNKQSRIFFKQIKSTVKIYKQQTNIFKTKEPDSKSLSLVPRRRISSALIGPD